MPDFINIPIYILQYTFYRGITELAWLGVGAMLSIARFIGFIEDWLLDFGINSLVSVLVTSSFGLWQAVVTLAVFLMFIMMTVSWLFKYQLVDPRKFVIYFIAGSLFFASSGTIANTMNDIRTGIRALAYSSIRADDGTLQPGVTDGLVAPPEFTASGPWSVCPRVDLYSDDLDALDATAAMICVSANDINTVPSLPATFANQHFNISSLQFILMTSTERDEAVSNASRGFSRMVGAYAGGGVAVAEAAVSLVLAAALVVIFVTLPLGLVFALFIPTEPIFLGILKEYMNLLVRTYVISILFGMILAVYEIAALSGHILLGIGTNLVALPIMLYILSVATKSISSSLNGLTGYAAQVTGGTGGFKAAAGIAGAGVAIAATAGLAAATGGTSLAAGGGGIIKSVLTKAAGTGGRRTLTGIKQQSTLNTKANKMGQLGKKQNNQAGNGGMTINQNYNRGDGNFGQSASNPANISAYKPGDATIARAQQLRQPTKPTTTRDANTTPYEPIDTSVAGNMKKKQEDAVVSPATGVAGEAGTGGYAGSGLPRPDGPLDSKAAKSSRSEIQQTRQAAAGENYKGNHRYVRESEVGHDPQDITNVEQALRAQGPALASLVTPGNPNVDINSKPVKEALAAAGAPTSFVETKAGQQDLQLLANSIANQQSGQPIDSSMVAAAVGSAIDSGFKNADMGSATASNLGLAPDAFGHQEHDINRFARSARDAGLSGGTAQQLVTEVGSGASSFAELSHTLRSDIQAAISEAPTANVSVDMLVSDARQVPIKPDTTDEEGA